MKQTEAPTHDPNEMQIYKSPIRTMFDKFTKHKDVTFIYGEPISQGKQSIIPVAKMNYYFGGGGGKGTNAESDETSHGQGEGGGGIVSVKPLGVYKMTDNKVRFKPIIDVNFMLIIFSVLTLGLAFFMRKKDDE